MPGRIVTLGEKKPEPIAEKPLNEIIEIQEGMSYIIKTADGRTLVINPNTIIGRAPKVGNLVIDYCAECKSYKYSDKFSTRCRYHSEYVCTQSTMVYFKEQKNVDEKKYIQKSESTKSTIYKIKEFLHIHMR